MISFTCAKGASWEGMGGVGEGRVTVVFTSITLSPTRSLLRDIQHCRWSDLRGIYSSLMTFD